MTPIIKSATVKYSLRLSLGQYEHEDLEIGMCTDAEPTHQDIYALLHEAKSTCFKLSGPPVKKATQKAIPPSQSVLAPPSPQAQAIPAAPALKPDPGFTARPSVAPTTHPYPGMYYGYKMPYRKPAGLEESLATYKAQKVVRWHGESKIWWASQQLPGWESYLVYNGMAQAQAAAAQHQASIPGPLFQSSGPSASETLAQVAPPATSFEDDPLPWDINQ